MAGLFKQLCLIVLTEACYDEFFIKFNFLHAPCLKAAVSKGLGLAIVAGSVLVKVPQIVKILGARSAEGISFLGTCLELFALLATVSYNYIMKYPFSAYGDGFFLLIQTATIGALVLHYKGATSKAIAFLLTILFSLLYLCSGLASVTAQWYMQASNIPIVFSGKMVQAWSNFCSGSTGQLSLITVLLLFLGSIARIFTSIQETGDMVIIITYMVATVANGVLVGQVMYYWNVPVKTKKE
ncbi:mannose-P-dolichol utilization defect 1 protein homolog [Oratosquilla oratoria]|uniref:mannose-P-dolichol utilization defect 1 protein homolog n=1 Tax=Oratosquilla oratoria TaxID=337810 RepID=UPI003F773B88